MYSINEFYASQSRAHSPPNPNQQNMADKDNRLSSNVSGRYYVADNCIDCDFCRGHAPVFFGRDDDLGLAIVVRQPMTNDEVALAEEALSNCPADAIGNDG